MASSLLAPVDITEFQTTEICSSVDLTKEQEVLGRTNLLLSLDTTRSAQKRTRPKILLFFHVSSYPNSTMGSCPRNK
jgi:hypothetical protein